MNFLFWAAFSIILSGCSIIYELLLASTLSIMTGNAIWWQSVTIGIYVGGLGVGTYTAERRNFSGISDLFRVEVVLTILGALTSTFLYLSHSAYQIIDFSSYLNADRYSSLYVQNSFIFKITYFFIVQSLTFAIGYFSGHEIPILIKLAAKAKTFTTPARILGYSYIGTLVGTLLFSHILLPGLDLIATAVVVASLNFVVVVALYIGTDSIRTKGRLTLQVLMAVFLIGLGASGSFIEQLYLKVLYYYQIEVTRPEGSFSTFLEKLPRIPEVERHKSPYQKIDIFEVKEGESQRTDRILTIDTHFQFSTGNERFYHEGFAHLPIALSGKIPKHVLVLGGGDGLLIRELLKYQEIEKITHVELDPEMLNLARNLPFLKERNEASLHHPKVTTILGDAFQVLRNSSENFDAIYIDFPYPKNYNLSKLYSVEFYTFVRKALSKEGFAVFDAPMVNRENKMKKVYIGRAVLGESFTRKDKERNSIFISSVHYAGFNKIFPYKIQGESFVYMSNSESEIHYSMDTLDRSKLQVLGDEILGAISSQEFPHQIDKQFVNSVFKPKAPGGRNF